VSVVLLYGTNLRILIPVMYIPILTYLLTYSFTNFSYLSVSQAARPVAQQWHELVTVKE